MRRLLFALLFVILPLQSVWAATAYYCRHEAGAVKHLGHHAHKHLKADGDTSSPSSSGVDADCASCHLGTTPLLLGAAVSLLALPASAPRFLYLWANLSHIPPGPERPDRPLAA